MFEVLPKPKSNPDDTLPLTRFVSKYQRDFATHFLPKHCIGVKIAQYIGNDIRVIARLKVLARLSLKTRNEDIFLIPAKDVWDWRNNVKLHTFMAGGI